MFAIEMVSKDDLQNGYKWCWSVCFILCTHVYVKEQTELTTFDKSNWI
jgi:hypothetical protein